MNKNSKTFAAIFKLDSGSERAVLVRASSALDVRILIKKARWQGTLLNVIEVLPAEFEAAPILSIVGQ